MAGVEAHDAIAVVGIGCRFPGASSPEEFWQLLSRGDTALSRVPPERWDADELLANAPGMPGKISSTVGGFIQDVELFDAEAFGIAPREAALMDPQQRLLLEVSLEALHDGAMFRATRDGPHA